MFTPKFPACAIHHGACLPIWATPPPGLTRAGGTPAVPAAGHREARAAAAGTARLTALTTEARPAAHDSWRRVGWTGVPAPAPADVPAVLVPSAPDLRRVMRDR